ncbi:ribokinase [Enterococcus sp. LJL98]
MSKKITVIGSLSTDFVVTTNQNPEQGETVFGEAFEIAFGGKGANQAVAAARLGAKVAMIGSVGSDLFGQELIDNLAANGICTANVERVPHISSGSAHITLYEQDNRIIVVPGANNHLNPEKIADLNEDILQSDLVILQNEIPQLTNEAIIQMCWEAGIPTIYNPAPARELAQEMIGKVTYLTPNEHEFAMIFPGEEMIEVLKRYPNQLIVTLGSKGSLFFDGQTEVLVPAIQVQALDTTGAGDTFNGAFAFALLQQLSLKDSLALANLAAAFSVQKFGAQGGMPTIDQLKGSTNYEKTWHFE